MTEPVEIDGDQFGSAEHDAFVRALDAAQQEAHKKRGHTFLIDEGAMLTAATLGGEQGLRDWRAGLLTCLGLRDLADRATRGAWWTEEHLPTHDAAADASSAASDHDDRR